jgi:hypothetical protein
MDVKDAVEPVQEEHDVQKEQEKITPSARYYRLHREEHLAKKKQEYANKPDVIAKRDAREQKKAAKDAEKEVKRQERERKLQERIAIAEATSHKKNLPTSKNELSPAL